MNKAIHSLLAGLNLVVTLIIGAETLLVARDLQWEWVWIGCVGTVLASWNTARMIHYATEL